MKSYLFLLAFLPLITAAQPTTLQNKAHVLKRFLDQHHYQPLSWNDSVSVLFYNKWVKNLDNEKLFFTSKDMEVLSAYKYKLDDELAGKEWKFFSLSTSLLLARLNKVDSMINLILSKPTDFSKPDVITWPFKDYAVSDQELLLRWQKYLKWRILADIADVIISKDSFLPVQH